MNKILAIVGPTGIGKSRLSVKLARIFNGEIISTDSRQVYRYMDIGTAKPTLEQREEIEHHLVDIINPDESFSLVDFQQMCYESIRQVFNRSKLPVLTGGSGQYTWSILEGWEAARVKPDLKLRKKLEEKASQNAEGLYEELKKLNPEAADRIDPRNTRRVIRSLEIAKTTGNAVPAKKNPQYNSLIIGLTAPRDKLYEMIDRRVDAMIQKGLVEEVASLVNRGYSLKLPSMTSIGYRQIGQYIKGELSLDNAIRQIKFESHRLVRTQYNWFSLTDRRIKWFDIMERDYTEKIIYLAREELTNI